MKRDRSLSVSMKSAGTSGNTSPDYASKWGKRYHFDNCYRPPLDLSSVLLHQAGEIIAGDGSADSNFSDLENFYRNAPLFMRNDKFQVRSAFEQLLTEIYLSQSYSKEVIDTCITQILVHVYRIFCFGDNQSIQRVVDETRPICPVSFVKKQA